MTEILYMIVRLIARIHNAIIRYCTIYFGEISDKWLHFIIIGLLGMFMIALIYPLFKLLASHNLIMAISWIYVFTLLGVISFAIEIGQKITNTGNMEFADIVAGLTGFQVMFLIMLILWGIWVLIKKGIRKLKQKKLKEQA